MQAFSFLFFFFASLLTFLLKMVRWVGFVKILSHSLACGMPSFSALLILPFEDGALGGGYEYFLKVVSLDCGMPSFSALLILLLKMVRLGGVL